MTGLEPVLFGIAGKLIMTAFNDAINKKNNSNNANKNNFAEVIDKINIIDSSLFTGNKVLNIKTNKQKSILLCYVGQKNKDFVKEHLTKLKCGNNINLDSFVNNIKNNIVVEDISYVFFTSSSGNHFYFGNISQDNIDMLKNDKQLKNVVGKIYSIEDQNEDNGEDDDYDDENDEDNDYDEDEEDDDNGNEEDHDNGNEEDDDNGNENFEDRNDDFY